MSPARPSAPHFDSALNAWVLSRYADVLAALQDSRLWPVSQPEQREGSGKLTARAALQEAYASGTLDEWQPAMEDSARRAVEALPSGVRVDLAGRLAQPWCLQLAQIVTGAATADGARLGELSAAAFAATGEPDDSPLQARASAAIKELQVLLSSAAVPMPEPTFVGVAQTLPRLLAGAWLALVEHPEEWRLLRAKPDLAPRAFEELLRYAGIVRSIVRRAREEVEIGAVRIPAGDRVLLLLASANRDPAQYPDPDRLDLTRRAAGQVALGAGRNSCVGAPLIRAAAVAATRALVARFHTAELCGAAEWRSGARFAWPVTVPAILREQPPPAQNL